MKKRNIWMSAVIAVLAAVTLMSCGGGGSSTCAEPLALTQGTWCITIQTTQNNCGAPLNSTPYTATFTQDGNALSAVSEFDHIYSGTICGNTAEMTGDNFGITTDMDMTFPDASHISGSVNWDTGTCAGTDTYTAVAGMCN